MHIIEARYSNSISSKQDAKNYNPEGTCKTGNPAKRQPEKLPTITGIALARLQGPLDSGLHGHLGSEVTNEPGKTLKMRLDWI